MPKISNKALGQAIGGRIYSACKARGVKIVTIANALGMTSYSFYLYKHKGTQPGAETLVAICHYLGTDSDYLLGIKKDDNYISNVPDEDLQQNTCKHSNHVRRE